MFYIEFPNVLSKFRMLKIFPPLLFVIFLSGCNYLHESTVEPGWELIHKELMSMYPSQRIDIRPDDNVINITFINAKRLDFLYKKIETDKNKTLNLSYDQIRQLPLFLEFDKIAKNTVKQINESPLLREQVLNKKIIKLQVLYRYENTILGFIPIGGGQGAFYELN